MLGWFLLAYFVLNIVGAIALIGETRTYTKGTTAFAVLLSLAFIIAIVLN